MAGRDEEEGMGEEEERAPYVLEVFTTATVLMRPGRMVVKLMVIMMLMGW